MCGMYNGSEEYRLVLSHDETDILSVKTNVEWLRIDPIKFSTSIEKTNVQYEILILYVKKLHLKWFRFLLRWIKKG